MKSIDYTDQSPIETFNKGRDKIQAERKEYSKGRTHRLKGGSVGCLLPDGKVLGVSLFQSIARYIGLEMPVSKTSLDTFSGGFLSEFDWLEKFKAANMPYKCEGDIPIRDEIAGRPLTGHPDIVPGVYDGETFTPSYGIELKAVLSVGTAAKVFLHQQPKDENFCQSCSYMYRMGVPWVLVYSNNTHFKTDSFIKRDFKGVDKILPQKVEFKIKCVNGRFYYQHPTTKEDIRTRVTIDGINDYYEALVESVETKDIGWFTLSDTDMLGKPSPWDVNLYDSYQIITDIKKGYNNWVDVVSGCCETGYSIIARKVNRKQVFHITKMDDIVETLPDLSEAREKLLTYIKI